MKTLEEIEADAIRKALEQTNGNRTKAADMLGITRRGLIYKYMDKYKSMLRKRNCKFLTDACQYIRHFRK